ncbi:MAG: hypothetical protein U1A78_05270 [Polyangia bacterium]
MSIGALSERALGSRSVAARWLRRAPARALAATLALVLVVTVAGLAHAAAAKGKAKGKGKGKGKVTQIELVKTLQDKSSEVQDCAMHALNHGTNRIDIGTRVTINGRGQVIDVRTTVNVDKGDGAPKVKDCVDSLVRTIKFPSTEAPLVTIERNWTIQTT